MTTAAVRLWGSTIGAVSWDAARALGFFEYAEAFRTGGVEVAPLTMPLSAAIYSFPALPRASFHGLPGLVADSLPDRYGTMLTDAWLARQGRPPGDMNPVERLCYTASRGMGALEYEPTLGPAAADGEALEVAELVELAGAILSRRGELSASLTAPSEALAQILRVGTSAGGARAKAIIAFNPSTGEVRSGQLPAGEGFSYWLLKFDGVRGNRDAQLDDPAGFGAVEYAYHRMAVRAGIEMTECRLLEEGPRRHFMTRRFDRTPGGDKLHMQTLGALAHLDFNQPGASAYEQAFAVMRRLRLPMSAIEQQFRRMLFNVVARNQDDHVKNIAFVMDRQGRWWLSPAYDVIFAFNPAGAFTGRHQMSINGKRDDFEVADLVACGKTVGLERGRARTLLEQVREAVAAWPALAAEADVAADRAKAVAALHRLRIDEVGRVR